MAQRKMKKSGVSGGAGRLDAGLAEAIIAAVREEGRRLDSTIERLDTRIERLDAKLDARIDQLHAKLDLRLDQLREEMASRFDATRDTINEVGQRMARVEGALEAYARMLEVRLGPLLPRKRKAG